MMAPDPVTPQKALSAQSKNGRVPFSPLSPKQAFPLISKLRNSAKKTIQYSNFIVESSSSNGHPSSSVPKSPSSVRGSSHLHQPHQYHQQHSSPRSGKQVISKYNLESVTKEWLAGCGSGSGSEKGVEKCSASPLAKRSMVLGMKSGIKNGSSSTKPQVKIVFVNFLFKIHYFIFFSFSLSLSLSPSFFHYIF